MRPGTVATGLPAYRPAAVFLAIAVFLGSVLAVRGVEYTLPSEPRYVAVDYPAEIENGRAGFILDFRPDSWLAYDLSGTWKLRVFRVEEGTRDINDPGLTEHYYDPSVSTSGWLDMPVPYSLSADDGATEGHSYFRGVAWYRRSFQVPQSWQTRLSEGWRVLLRLEAFQAYGDAWFNGASLGPRMTGLAAHEFDVTGQLLTQSANVVALRICAGGDSYQGRQRDGLWQPVRLLCVPPVHARPLLIAPVIDPEGLIVTAHVRNHGGPRQALFEAELTPVNIAGEPTRTYSLGTAQLDSGESTQRLYIETPGVKLWTPDMPNLYLLTLRDGSTELGRERIGFRRSETRNGHFFLNGEKTKLMGFQFGSIKNEKSPGTWSCNAGNYARKLLHNFKQAGVNFARPHNGADGGLPKTMYYLCDELGFLIYDEYIRADSGMLDPDRLATRMQDYEAWVLQTHNHPACVMWDFGGNELYDEDPRLTEVLNHLYDLLGDVDRQHRPRTSSSGRMTWQRMDHLDPMDKIDFADSHRYDGYYDKSYQDMAGHFENLRYWSNQRCGNIPTINCEWGCPGDIARYRSNTPDIRALYEKPVWGDAEMAEFIGYAESDIAEIGGYLSLKMNWAGGRIWTTDPLHLWERHSIYAKRPLELFRCMGDCVDGGHFNTPWYDLFPWSDGGHEGLHAAIRYLGLPKPWSVSEDSFLKAPAFYTWRRAYQPAYLCLDIHDKNLLAGRAWEGTVQLMNDSASARGAAHAVVQVRDPNGALLHQDRFWDGTITAWLRETVTLRIAVPSAWPTGRYPLELYLLDDAENHVSENHYVLNVRNSADMIPRITPAGNVGLYEPAPNPAATSTRAILESLSIPFQTVQDFTELGSLDVLIIGRYSLDTTVGQNGAAISDWVRAGGRLLCFEQTQEGPLPFMPELSIRSWRSGTFTELLKTNHPIFEGLSQELFDDWDGGSGILYAKAFLPLHPSTLSVGPVRDKGDQQAMGYVRPISVCHRLGQGEIVLSQYRLNRRYGIDAVATRLTQNLLCYALGALVARGSEWRYDDTGTDLGTAWRARTYDDSAWQAGDAVLGYGESYVDTTVSYGGQANDKHVTTYFRRRFRADNPTAIGRLTLHALYDDGFVAYLNGQEVARRSMGSGSVTFNTPASSHEGDAYETIDLTAHIGKLRTGENVLAVEVHQTGATSSDLVMDMELQSAASSGGPPAAPRNLEAVAVSPSEIRLSWTDLENETEYKVRRSADGLDWGTLGSVMLPAGATTYTDTGLVPGTVLYYKVRAGNGAGSGPYCVPRSDTTPEPAPSVPGAVTAGALSSTRVRLTWLDVAGESGYEIRRSVAGIYWDTLDPVMVGANTTSYTDSGLEPDVVYYYRIRAVAGDAAGEYTDPVRAETPDAVPATPTGLTANALSPNELRISWRDLPNEAMYKIRRSLDGVDWYTLADIREAANATTFVDAGLTPGQRYWYKIKAINALGASAYSAPVQAPLIRVKPGEFTAYNDLCWESSQADLPNVTRYSRKQGGLLMDHATGDCLPVTLTVDAGGAGPYAEQGTDATAGTDADAVFGGLVDCAGCVGYTESDLRLTLAALDPALRYELVLFGNRAQPSYAARTTTLILEDAAAFENGSSAGATVQTSAMPDDTTVIANGANTANGYVARYLSIDPGSDGTITIRIPAWSGTGDAGRYYLNALMLKSTIGEPVQLLGRGGQWRYRRGTREASVPAPAWRAGPAGFDDTSWPTGSAPFGYSSEPAEGPFGTTLSNMRGNYTSLFLRRTFEVHDPARITALELAASYDDGFIVWLNGEELARVNMSTPAGTFVPYDGLAGSQTEPTDWAMRFARSEMPQLQRGTNVLAVQAFNGALGSSDFVFDAQLAVLRYQWSIADDADDDGMPDAWESAELGDTTPTAHGDADGDGVSNIEEWIAGTSPRDETGYLKLETRLQNGQIVVSFHALAATGPGYTGLTRHYQLQTRGMLAGPDQWLAVAGYEDVVATGSEVVYVNTAGNGPDFYRARVWLSD